MNSHQQLFLERDKYILAMLTKLYSDMTFLSKTKHNNGMIYLFIIRQ